LISLRAGALGLAGRSVEGVEQIDAALSSFDESDPQRPDLAVLKGNLLLAAGDGTGAVRSFRGALEAGERAGARIAALRAAVGLCRIEPESQAAAAELRRVYDAFTEGFETPDLVEARETLDAPAGRLVSRG
jgi:hypothetical protein